MPVISALELASSPREAPSYAVSTFWWDPTNELLAGETISAPQATVTRYDPAFADNAADFQDVTASVLTGGTVTIGSGVHANMVQISFDAFTLTIGYDYRVELSATGSLGSTPSRFFRVRCRV